MFDFFNPFDFLLSLELSKYLFSALFVCGVFILTKCLVLKKGV